MMMHRLTVIFFWFYSLTVVVFGDQVVWEGGTNTPSAGVMHEFTGLDIATVSVYLTVEVYQSKCVLCTCSHIVYTVSFKYNSLFVQPISSIRTSTSLQFKRTSS